MQCVQYNAKRRIENNTILRLGLTTHTLHYRLDRSVIDLRITYTCASCQDSHHAM